MTEYVDRYRNPLGYLMVTWLVVYLVLWAYVVVVQNDPFDTGLLIGAGLFFAFVVAYLLDRNL